MKLSWEDAQTFLTVVECRSFSAAAKVLGVGQPTISRRIQNLERNLEQNLFVRGKHGASPTEIAQQLIPAARQMAQWAGEFDRAAMQVEQNLQGLVRIAAPPGIAVELLAPFAAELKEKEPGIRLEVLAGIEHIDLVRGAADFAIRIQVPTEHGLEVVHKTSVQPKIVASSAYVRSLPEHYTLTDIDWVTWGSPYKHVAPRPMLERLIADFEPAFCSDDYLVMKEAVRQGMGAMIVGRLLGGGLEQGLEEITLDLNLPQSEFYIVAAKSVRHVARVNCVIEQLAQRLRTLDS